MSDIEKLFDRWPTLNNNRIIIKKIDIKSLSLLEEMISHDNVYRYVPTFVPELVYSHDLFH